MIDRVGQVYSVTFKRSSTMSSGFFVCVAIFLATSQILRSCPAQNTAGASQILKKGSLWSFMDISCQNNEVDLRSAVVENAAVPRLP